MKVLPEHFNNVQKAIVSALVKVMSEHMKTSVTDISKEFGIDAFDVAEAVCMGAGLAYENLLAVVHENSPENAEKIAGAVKETTRQVDEMQEIIRKTRN
jgi:DNA-directed RNA polymerase specialized sigma subunit